MSTNHRRIGDLSRSKKALNSGNLYLQQSHNHRHFWETVYEDEDWQQRKTNAYSDLGLPGTFDEILQKLRLEFEHNAQLAETVLQYCSSILSCMACIALKVGES